MQELIIGNSYTFEKLSNHLQTGLAAASDGGC